MYLLLPHLGTRVPFDHDAAVVVQLVADDLANPKLHHGRPGDDLHAARGEISKVILDLSLDLTNVHGWG